ncbi:hypothetical protein [Acinetobacter sp. CFCC 10889]|uniref:hypothetical protein n=1 Tax=Acinetobacter sp. CFCC 10889 TaxID=1775557 RepID=UPI000DCF87E7|nr:hypothetical protein [Acinetobacter sp. CFCC 10889]
MLGYRLKFHITLEKWVGKRRGRLSELARRLNTKRQTLWSRISVYGLSLLEMDRIKVQQFKIERDEKRAIDLLRFMKKWMSKKQGRQIALAQRMGITPFALRQLCNAKKDKRYSILKYGITAVRQAIREIERNLKIALNHIII